MEKSSAARHVEMMEGMTGLGYKIKNMEANVLRQLVKGREKGFVEVQAPQFVLKTNSNDIISAIRCIADANSNQDPTPSDEQKSWKR